MSKLFSVSFSFFSSKMLVFELLPSSLVLTEETLRWLRSDFRMLVLRFCTALALKDAVKHSKKKIERYVVLQFFIQILHKSI